MSANVRQREREADHAIREAQRALEEAAERLLVEAKTGRLLTLATPVVQRLEEAHAGVARARHALRELAHGEAVEVPPLHAFAPNAEGHCATCGKGWAGGHEPTLAPPLPDPRFNGAT